MNNAMIKLLLKLFNFNKYMVKYLNYFLLLRTCVYFRKNEIINSAILRLLIQ